MVVATTAILDRLQQEINSDAVRLKYRQRVVDFTRDRLLSFGRLVYLRLHMMNKSTSVELSKFMDTFVGVSASKQAFSKAIQKIKWEGFAHFNDFFVRDYYQSAEYKRYKDRYTLIATDGTTMELPYEPQLIAHFGQHDNGQTTQPICIGMSVKLYDVLNNISISTSLSPYQLDQSKGNSEQALFEERLEDLKTLLPGKEKEIILIGDKYYPSFYYLVELPERVGHFVFRCKASFCKEVKAFAASGEQDAILTIDLNKSARKYSSSAKRLDKKIDQIEVRCVRIDRPNGEPMFLLTDLSNEQLSRAELGDIYGLRWGEETSFDVDKNLVEVENFASKSVNGVLQEFYAKTLTANIASLVMAQAQAQLEEEQKNKDNKYVYKINRAVAIGLLKDEIVPFLNGSQPAEDWMKRMVKMVLPHRSPVRKGRSFQKKRKHKLKFSMTKRRVT